MSYTLDPGSGYAPAINPNGTERDVTTGWEGAQGAFDNFDYAKTWTNAGTFTLGGKVAKLYAKPGYTGSLITGDIPQDQRAWVIDDDIALTGIKINPETTNSVAPSVSLSMTRSASTVTLNSSGQATVNFSATASVSNGTYTPTTEPTALRYNIIDGSTSTSALAQNTTSKSWSHTFTSAGTYTVGARYRKNFCAEGRSSCNNTDSSNTFIFDEASVSVVVKAGGPTGNKPKAQIQPVTYSSVDGGCGYGLSGITTPVEAFATIQLTQGTGDFVYARAEASGWTANGSTLQRSFARNAIGNFGGTLGTTVKFYNSAGELIHSEGSGNQNWCINIEQFTYNPGPGGPDLDPF